MDRESRCVVDQAQADPVDAQLVEHLAVAGDAGRWISDRARYHGSWIDARAIRWTR
jgi:hypothetical protein